MNLLKTADRVINVLFNSKAITSLGSLKPDLVSFCSAVCQDISSARGNKNENTIRITQTHQVAFNELVTRAMALNITRVDFIPFFMDIINRKASQYFEAFGQFLNAWLRNCGISPQSW